MLQAGNVQDASLATFYTKTHLELPIAFAINLYPHCQHAGIAAYALSLRLHISVLLKSEAALSRPYPATTTAVVAGYALLMN